MAKEVVLPQLGQSMREGTIVKMRVQAGQTVNPG
ncbi:MAG: biotin attachment protein, partial [Planctomycetes bacterium]|nr:biotin attachment protein [Planctomycetota bacterium]